MHKNLWHPFTILKDAPDPIKVKSGKGSWLTLEDGREVIDAISSWWVNIHGHTHPEVADAIYEQAQTLEHVIFAGFTHDPAEQLAEMLVEKLPKNLNRVFYSDNGSTAVEVGMKLAYQFWRNKGETRKTFICFEGAYHGDTFGAMSAGERSVFTDVFKDLLFDVEVLPFPETWIDDKSRSTKEDEIIEKLEDLLAKNPDKYAGILMEPLVQGAGGMRMCSEEFLQKLHWVNRQFGVLLIFDEVMTGFGRTGDYFACKRAQVEPDIICLSKGITAGFMPLAATVCSDEIYQTFNSSDPIKTFWHGHSYTANPIGCAAGVASMKILEREEAFKNVEEIHKTEIQKLKNHPKLEHFRITGTIAAMDIKNDEEGGYLNSAAKKIKEECVDHGVLLRPLGNVLYVMAPYCTSEKELQKIYSVIAEIVD
ncbi:MAG: adenosylmethionine--8-amino-7-oxononanoate transaminase [Balneola sp.]|jgi:adenosylmethionine-8-amino-7-oxononanoate aminotransferase|nr:adenosylmethionine--8-amino-7-oxononanoate transaminase [Balneola sp.]MBE79602.1 adenosylmethionine--8-amino-7-oxononanoate transaminase [Balneola sp.]|tara:strand:+ start:948 stop:2216 length:1269 start_codon:yes stop_codon:yes gene_type:complete